MNSRPSLLRTLLLVVALWSGIGVFAQPGKTKVVLYKDRLAAAFDTVDCVKNVVKFNPLAFFRGEVPVYFERALSARLSLEVGVGVTLTCTWSWHTPEMMRTSSVPVRDGSKAQLPSGFRGTTSWMTSEPNGSYVDLLRAPQLHQGHSA
ncbi:MAG: hypothetical protein IPF64_17455 [Flavobacteriales bacterium]|nr:hypothetical protein [Flavobacteriales bacterium]